MRITRWLIVPLCFINISTFATDEPDAKEKAEIHKHCIAHCKNKHNHKSYWKGSNAQIGYIKNTGNTDSSDLNLAGNIQFTKNRWGNLFQGQYEYGKADGVANRNYGHLYDQIQYSLNDHTKRDNYIFANGDGQFSKYSPYTYQTVYVAGYGRDWINTKHFSLSAQIGPGYRRNKAEGGGIEDSYVASSQVLATLTLGSKGTLTETLRYDLAPTSYNYTRSVTAFTNKIIANVAVQLSYTITHVSKIPITSTNTKKTDTQVNISLVYNFVK